MSAGRRLSCIAAALLIAACAARPPVRGPQPAAEPPRAHKAIPGSEAEPSDGPPVGVEIDLATIPEPVPRAEPRSRYGNHSPYTVHGRTYRVLESAKGYVERGLASWYGTKFHGRPTSSFEPYDMFQYTAAHRTLPLPTYARVTNLENGENVVVRINDRGPFKPGRIIDLSYVAALRLGIVAKGTAMVEVRALDPEQAEPGPVAGPHPSDGGPVFVQVGAFLERENARRARSRLKEAGLAGVRMTRVRANGRTFWRVRLGPFREAAQASRVLAEVRRLGFPAAQLVRSS
jgi:rare lipoprotein A